MWMTIKIRSWTVMSLNEYSGARSRASRAIQFSARRSARLAEPSLVAHERERVSGSGLTSCSAGDLAMSMLSSSGGGVIGTQNRTCLDLYHQPVMWKDGYGGELGECSLVGEEGWVLPMACISCFGLAGRGSG